MKAFENKLAEWTSIHDELLALERKLRESLGTMDAESVRQYRDKIGRLNVASEVALKALCDCFEAKRLRL